MLLIYIKTYSLLQCGGERKKREREGGDEEKEKKEKGRMRGGESDMTN